MAPVLVTILLTMGIMGGQVSGTTMGTTMVLMGALVTLAMGERINIVSVSDDLLVKQGHSANMTCTTDQVTILSHFSVSSYLLSPF